MKETRIRLWSAKQDLVDEYEEEVSRGDAELIKECWQLMCGEQAVAIETEDGDDQDIVLVIRESTPS